MIEILTSGALNSIQDTGRKGYLALGVSHSGAMDQLALAMGNGLLGNPADAAAVEVAFFPFRMRFLAAAMVAVTGADCTASVDGASMPPCWARSMDTGQTLTLAPPVSGTRAYVCIGGGIDVPLVMGSRSTDVKTRFGGHCGRALMRGDRLDALPPSEANNILDAFGFGALSPDEETSSEADVIRLRFLPAAEHDAFEPHARRDLVEAEWEVSTQANRMGYRLDGPKLELTETLELFSHGILPGTVQVPPSGQPIIQLADANTCGGYPKIATVIEADLWKLAQAPVGARLSFVETNRNHAVEVLRAQHRWLGDLRATARLLTG